MCLEYASKDIGLIKWDKNGEKVAWKIYKRKYDYIRDKYILEADIYPYSPAGPLDGPGEVISDRVSKNWNNGEKADRAIDKGIHVYLAKPSNECSSGRVIVPVRCKKEDFVALNNFYFQPRQAVFMKVRITRHSWRKYVR